jgi:3',5'-nucleoside bisphosphate phosphatase
VLADLHLHSTVSDGWRDPDAVAHLAADHGVGVMALTDHDSFFGIDRARVVAHARGLGYVPGLEITTYPPNQMRHILGHGVDSQNRQLLGIIERTRAVFRRQTLAWIERLLAEGLGGDLGLETLANKPALMPGAVVRLLLQHQRMTESAAWASARRAAETLPPDFDQPVPSPREAVDAIHAAGGLAVQAHPGSVPDQELMKEVLPLVDGLEVYTRRHSPEQIPVYEALARQHGLLMTVGTDYHGFLGADYEAPRKVIDFRYLETLGPRIQWPAVDKAG